LPARCPTILPGLCRSCAVAHPKAVHEPVRRAQRRAPGGAAGNGHVNGRWHYRDDPADRTLVNRPVQF
jgi:hypothetical protein